MRHRDNNKYEDKSHDQRRLLLDQQIGAIGNGLHDQHADKSTHQGFTAADHGPYDDGRSLSEREYRRIDEGTPGGEKAASEARHGAADAEDHYLESPDVVPQQFHTQFVRPKTFDPQSERTTREHAERNINRSGENDRKRQ